MVGVLLTTGGSKKGNVMERFEFKLCGPIFEGGVPIHLAIKAWDNFQSIVDKTYLVTTQTQKISAKEREKYYLRASKFEQSSFLTNFEIILTGVQLALPLVSIAAPQSLWDYTVGTFNFLKLSRTYVSNVNAKIMERIQNRTVTWVSLHCFISKW